MHNRQSCANSPIPSHFLKDAATPGVCASYADTLIAVNAALEEQGIPIKHFLLDSWWCECSRSLCVFLGSLKEAAAQTARAGTAAPRCGKTCRSAP